MTPTPAETALWRALNPGKSDWLFGERHPADRLAYFEGKVRERGMMFGCAEQADNWLAVWAQAANATRIIAERPTEHLARFFAVTRALAVLKVITEQEWKEIEQ